jgi:hypothetical protein
MYIATEDFFSVCKTGTNKMGVADYRGARGSLAGTSFHELWALHQAMRLHDSRSNLAAVALEGFGQNVKSSEDRTEYDGVDCALLYGDSDVAKAQCVEIAQLKYSGSQPHSNWTLAKLTKSDKKKGNNSVLRRLASAFNGLTALTSGQIVVRLVSNQKVATNVEESFARLRSSRIISKPIKETLRKATGLSQAKLADFANVLDLTSQTGSRFQLEEELLLEISRWTDDDANSVLELMLGFIRKQMSP